MDLSKKVQSPWANVKSATERASYENLAQDFKSLNLGPKRPSRRNGGSKRNSKRLDSRKKLRKNRRATKTRRYRK